MTEPEIQKVEKLPEANADAEDRPGVDPVDHVEDTEAAEEPEDVQDVDMDPEDHVNRPDQPGFDPAERAPYDDPDPDVLPTASKDSGD